MPEKPGGPIDPYSPWSLRDFVEGNVDDPDGPEDPQNFEWYGFHLIHTGDDDYIVCRNGHIESVHEFRPEDYDDVLELVDDLMEITLRDVDFQYRDDTKGLVEWAGPQVTDDPEEYQENPELYVDIDKVGTVEDEVEDDVE